MDTLNNRKVLEVKLSLSYILRAVMICSLMVTVVMFSYFAFIRQFIYSIVFFVEAFCTLWILYRIRTVGNKIKEEINGLP